MPIGSLPRIVVSQLRSSKAVPSFAIKAHGARSAQQEMIYATGYQGDWPCAENKRAGGVERAPKKGGGVVGWNAPKALMR